MDKLLKRRFEITLLTCFLLFSWWLMGKSFGYDSVHQFRIARHQIGDFGLHLSLIRSFSWGANVTVESPFFPGRPLPYHYYFDFLVGTLEKLGVRIDVALNGLSALFFTALLLFIYKLPQVIFKKGRLIGILSVALFILQSSTTFLDFLKGKSFSLAAVRDLWSIPDYIHKGPFDGSLISIFFTLNVFLNQRHLVAALAISFGIFLFLIERLLKSKKISYLALLLLGILLGFSSRVHTLIFLSTLMSIPLLFLLFRYVRQLPFLVIPAVLVFGFQARDIFNQNLVHPFLNLGFLAERPISLNSFITFWFLNLGFAFFTIPLGFLLSSTKQKKVLISVLPLFIIGNVLQLSFRIEHNHSLFNLFFIFADFYTAFLLMKLWEGNLIQKCIFPILLFFLTFSGFLNLMVVKNDFQYYHLDAPSNMFIQWIKSHTDKKDIFLSRQEILDPVTLAGRRNYYGHEYYLLVMGYDYSQRRSLAKLFFEASDNETLSLMKKEGIHYLAVPARTFEDFHYNVNLTFLKTSLPLVYEDKDVVVFRL